MEYWSHSLTHHCAIYIVISALDCCSITFETDVSVNATSTPWWWLPVGAETRRSVGKDKCMLLVDILFVVHTMRGTDDIKIRLVEGSVEKVWKSVGIRWLGQEDQVQSCRRSEWHSGVVEEKLKQARPDVGAAVFLVSVSNRGVFRSRHCFHLSSHANVHRCETRVSCESVLSSYPLRHVEFITRETWGLKLSDAPSCERNFRFHTRRQ
jgi:hypothetical protein